MKKIKEFLLSIEDFLELERELDSLHNTHMYVIGFFFVIVFFLDKIFDEKYPSLIEYSLSIYNEFMTQQIDNQIIWIIYGIILVLITVCVLNFLIHTIFLTIKKFFLLTQFIIQKIKLK